MRIADDTGSTGLGRFGIKGLFTVLILIVVIIGLAPFTIVPAGRRGIMLTMGRAEPTPLVDGFHWRWPLIQRVSLMPVTIQRSETDSEAASSDLQRVRTTVVLNYHVEPSQVVVVYTSIGPIDTVTPTIVDPAVQEAMKAVTAQYTAEELVTKRPVVSSAIRAMLEDRFKRHGLVIDEFSVTNFHFSPAFDSAIEAKTVAEQQVLTAKRTLERIKVEAEQREAEAKGQADALRLTAIAQADALRVQREQVTPELVQLREVEATLKAIEKWDGRLPQVTGSATPFIQLPAK